MVKATGLPYKHTVGYTAVRHAGQESTADTLSRRIAATTGFSTEGVGWQKQTAPSFTNNPIRPARP